MRFSPSPSHSTAAAYLYKVLIFSGNNTYVCASHKTVTGGHNPLKLLSFDNWSCRPRHCCISIPNTSTALPYDKQSKQEWLSWFSLLPTPNRCSMRAQDHGSFLYLSKSLVSSNSFRQILLSSGYEICIGR